MAFDNPKQKRTVILLTILTIIVIIVVAFLLKGKNGIWAVIKTVFWLSLIGSVVFCVGLIVYHLFFKKQRVDVTYKYKQGLIRAGKISKPTHMIDLWCKGDKTHQAVKIGKIVGYCRIENYSETLKQEERQEDVFIVQTSGFLVSLFTDPVVVRVDVNDWEGITHVYLKGINLVEVGQYYYLHKDMLKLDLIDKTIKSEALRYVTLDSYSDYMTLIKRAEGLDTEFNKEMDQKKLLKIPQINQPNQP